MLTQIGFLPSTGSPRSAASPAQLQLGSGWKDPITVPRACDLSSCKGLHTQKCPTFGCFAVLKFLTIVLIILNKRTLHFHFILGHTNYVVGLMMPYSDEFISQQQLVSCAGSHHIWLRARTNNFLWNRLVFILRQEGPDPTQPPQTHTQKVVIIPFERWSTSANSG